MTDPRTGPDERRARRSLVGASAGFFVVMLDTTIVNVALPSIGAGLHASFQGLQWVVNAYAIALAALLLGAGGMADRFGTRRVYEASLLLFAIASLGCALSPELWVLLASRFAQGVAGASLIPTSMVLAADGCRTPEERSVALGWWGSAGGLAAAMGPVLGGCLVSTLGWRCVFWVNVPICVLIRLVLTGNGSRRAGRSRRRAAPSDGAGQLLSILAIGLTSFSVIELGSSSTRILGSAGCAAAAASWWAFLRYESRSAKAFLEMALFRVPAFATNCAIGWILNFALFGELFVLSMYLQQGLGYSSAHAGLVIFPQTCSALIAAPLGGRAAAAWGGRRATAVGLTAGGIGFLGIALFPLTGSQAVLAPLSFLASFGMAFAMPPVSAEAIGSVAERRKGMASGVINTARQLGTVCGTAAMGAVYAIAGATMGVVVSVAIAALLFFIGALASWSVGSAGASARGA